MAFNHVFFDITTGAITPPAVTASPPPWHEGPGPSLCSASCRRWLWPSLAAWYRCRKKSFFRTVSFVTGRSASAFALTLGVFLIGLASGSRKATQSCRRTVDEAIHRVLRDVIVAKPAGNPFPAAAGPLGMAGGRHTGRGFVDGRHNLGQRP
jgi:hypothetical protein